MQPNWKDPDLLPAFDGQRWAVIERGRLQRCDDFEVRNKLKRWVPSSALIVAAPGYRAFVPPSQVPEMQPTIWQTLRRRRLMAIVPFLLLTIAEILMFFWQPDPHRLAWALTFGMLAALFSYDYLIAIDSHEAMDERTRFFYWLTNKVSGANAIVWIGLGLAAVGFQYWLMRDGRGTAEVLSAVGVLHGQIIEGEFWRVLTGPFIHTTIMHFLATWILLVLIGYVASALYGLTTSLIVFIVGNAIGSWTQALASGPEALASASGMSFGMLALLGLIFGGAACHRALLPRGMTMMSLFIAITFMAGAEATAPTAGTIGHLTAWLCGGLAGAISQYFASTHRPSDLESLSP